ncbi:putative Receptor protein kinase [Melia azedarach]|uniref:Receptor protein kinase n=1 Tax=Melia azedarach TaxID=155640 RepID=A0ACC1Y339_MELAZ|nr:putative Receptor protein kinase [Melia azedarach]
MAIKGRIYHVLLSFSFFVLLTELSYSQTDKLLRGQLLKDDDELVSAFGKTSGTSYSQTDKLLQGQLLKDGDVLVSAYGNFKLGFFSPDQYTRQRYLGIWYDKPRDRTFRRYYQEPIRPVWIANCYSPVLAYESTSLAIDSTDGNLKILRDGGTPIQISSVPRAGNTSAILHKNGNFVLYEMNSDGSIRRELWQSFDNPTNTLLPGMKLGLDLQTGKKWFVRSWNGNGSAGSYTLGIDPNVTNMLIIWKNSEVYWKTLTIGSDFGTLTDDTEVDILCVVFGGCLPDTSPDCRKSLDNFHVKYGFTAEEGSKFGENEGDNLTCQDKCMSDCSCIACASRKTDNYTICEIWSKGIKFIETPRDKSSAREIYLYVEPKEMQWWQWLIIAIVIALIVCLLLSFGYVKRRKCKAEEEKWWMSLMVVAKVESIINRQKLLRELGDSNRSLPTRFWKGKPQAKVQNMKRDLKIFDFQSIAAATNNFSTANRLGQGGFGTVYKGKLLDGQEIAIKRLSKSSGQGIMEFKNEAKLISKLQHTNLVRLLGCSLQGGERLLVYEYLPNKSLDFFIFEGIAQGLLYLHKYSRLRVIHRDLKAGNILLDELMNPKISDFGMAKTFAMNELEANTNRIVGTHGYMSPEYVLKGIVSMKSDVYSFGVLVLEVVTGKKNNSTTQRSLNLVGYAWQLWNEGKGLELIDKKIDESHSPKEVLRCIHVGLLCVQDRATDRPTMSDVVSMLTNESMALPAPKQPAFFINVASDQEPEVTEIKLELCSVNDVTISGMEAR